MKRFQDTPAFWRYFGARLKPFTRPLFLGSVGFLTLSGIAFYQYWNRPYWLQNQIEQPLKAVLGSRNSNQISPELEEDLAALADVDNIELLLQEIAQNQVANSFNSVSTANKNSKKKSPNTKFSRFKKEQENKLKNVGSSESSYLKSNNNALDNLLKPPSLINYSSKISTQKTNNSVGKLYFSNKNSTSNNSVNSSYLQTSPLSKIGDRSGSFNIRKPPVNATERGENTNNLTNQNQVSTSNTAIPNQQTGINNFSTRFVPPSSLNPTGNINTQNNKNGIQSNSYNPYIVPTPNYNQSVPNNYQLQPQSFGQNNSGSFFQTNNQLNRKNSLSNSTQNQQLNNTDNPNVNQPTTNVFSNPTLQPAGSLSTSPIK